MSKHIGIVACSAEGAALCYRTICREGPSILGRYMHPEITMHTHPLGDYMKHIEAGDQEGVAALMLSSARKAAGAGADFLICPDNTIHEALPFVIPRSPLPWLHIAEVVAAEAKRRGFMKIGITGTKYLMEGPVYPTALAKFGLDHLIPSPAEREEINRIIFEELVNAVITDQSREYFVGVIEGLKARGCDAVVLGCTEIPLLIDDSVSPLPTLDSTRLLARAALREATE
jgi:aspartate racemase